MSEIRSLYRDENDLFRTVIKRIWGGMGIYIGGLGVRAEAGAGNRV